LLASGVSRAARLGSVLARERVKWTSFVRVSRSAMNQARQPERWNHHSRCTPATFVRK
jgi:hypothetical protein